MTDRDRLIHKIMSLKKPTISLQTAMDIADALIDEGAIVPPCKVGDTVYYIAGKKIYKSKCHALTQHKSGLQIHLYDYDGDNARYSTKDVFRTREEAKEKLREIK